MENETPLLSLEDEPNLPKLDLTPPFRIDDDPDILNSKIGKFNDAYGDESPGTDQIKANLLAGAEGDMRAQLKATVELRRSQALQGYVDSKARLAALEGREVSQEEYQGALTLQSWSLPSEAVVLEQEAARKALEPTREGTPDSIDKMLVGVHQIDTLPALTVLRLKVHHDFESLLVVREVRLNPRTQEATYGLAGLPIERHKSTVLPGVAHYESRDLTPELVHVPRKVLVHPG